MSVIEIVNVLLTYKKRGFIIWSRAIFWSLLEYDISFYESRMRERQLIALL
jgi:hypothetical protein